MDTSQIPPPRVDRRPASSLITAPIPLLAFLGAIVEGIIAILAYGVRDAPQDRALFISLVLCAIVLPVVLVSTIYRLITHHHAKLYAPFHFTREQDFLRVLEETRPAVERLGRLNRQDQYRPFMLTHETSAKDISVVDDHARQWEDLLASMTAAEFVALHSWYNENGSDAIALLCLDIAIAKGMITSKNFSFRAANLRHMGRLTEARHSAELALELDGTNIDAHYNLAKALTLMGLRSEGRKHAQKVLEKEDGDYAPRLKPLFPDLVKASAVTPASN